MSEKLHMNPKPRETGMKIDDMLSREEGVIRQKIRSLESFRDDFRVCVVKHKQQ